MNMPNQYDSMDVYTQKMLADGAELALARFKRKNQLEALDIDRLVQLVNLFNDALEADRAILGAQMASSTDKSVSVLSMVTEALTRLTPTDEIRSAVERMKEIAERAIAGTSLDEKDHELLSSFLRHYSIFQDDRLRRQRSEEGEVGGLWPESTLMTSL